MSPINSLPRETPFNSKFEPQRAHLSNSDKESVEQFINEDIDRSITIQRRLSYITVSDAARYAVQSVSRALSPYEAQGVVRIIEAMSNKNYIRVDVKTRQGLVTVERWVMPTIEGNAEERIIEARRRIHKWLDEAYPTPYTLEQFKKHWRNQMKGINGNK